MSILAIIPARGGSKELPRKNILGLGGKPVIAWTIEAAQQAQMVDRVVVSTEDNEIADIARNWGAEVPFLRPSELAEDESSVIDVVRHALDQLPAVDWVLLLQPTSPLRTHEDIDAMIHHCHDAGASATVSVREVGKHPRWMYQLSPTGNLKPVIEVPLIARRQEFPEAFELNGAMYLAKTEWLKNQSHFISPETLGYVMPPERSVDIDKPQDLLWAEFLLLNYKRNRANQKG